METSTPAFNRSALILWTLLEGKELVGSMRSARANAKRVRAEVDARVAPIFASFRFPVSAEWADHEGELVTKPGNLYLCDDEGLCAKYYEAVRDAHAAAGWTGNRESCPALVAEEVQRKAEIAVLTSLSKVLGVDCNGWRTLKQRAEILSLAEQGVAIGE